MSDFSAIEWTDATWNPVTGCTKVSQGCKNCYAERDWVRLSANPRSIYFKRSFTDVQCHTDRLHQPFDWAKPRRIFVNSMSDLFHESVPDEFIGQVFFVMARAKHHIFQVLTKRPERMLAWTIDHGLDSIRYGEEHDIAEQRKQWPWPLSNIWLGISVEDQATTYERIPLLLQTPAAVRWISAEPLLGPIDLRDEPNDFGEPRFSYLDRVDGVGPRIDWVVAGGESGPRSRPSHPDWFRSLRDQCHAAGVPFFFKQWGEWAPMPPIQALISAYRGIALDKHGNAPNMADLHRMIAGDFSCLLGREQLCRVGKKTAGRLLDGREWNEYPA